MAKSKDLHLKLSEKMHTTIEDRCREHNLNKSEYIRELIRQDDSDSTIDKKIENIEYEIKQIKKSVKSIKDRIPDDQGY